MIDFVSIKSKEHEDIMVDNLCPIPAMLINQSEKSRRKSPSTKADNRGGREVKPCYKDMAPAFPSCYVQAISLGRDEGHFSRTKWKGTQNHSNPDLQMGMWEVG